MKKNNIPQLNKQLSPQSKSLAPPPRSASVATLPPPSRSPVENNSPGIKALAPKPSAKEDSDSDASSKSSSSNKEAKEKREVEGNAGVDEFGHTVPETGIGDSLDQLFRDYATSEGFINGNDLCDILHELGLDSDDETVRDLLACAWEEIDMDAAKEVVETLRAKHQNKVVTKVVEETTKETIYLTVGDYIWTTISCAKREDVEYVIKWPSFQLQPRQILIGSTGIVMLLAGGMMILVMALLWMQHSGNSEDKKFEQFSIAIETYISNFEQQLLRRNGAEQADMALMLSQFIERGGEVALDFRASKAMKQAGAGASSFNLMASRTQLAKLKEIEFYGKSIEKVLQIHVSQVATSSSATVNALFQKILQSISNTYPPSAGWHVLAVSANGVVLYDPEGTCAGNTSKCRKEIPCLAASTFAQVNSVVFEQTIGPFSNGVSAVGMHFGAEPKLVDHQLCIYKNQDRINTESQQLAAMNSIFTYDREVHSPRTGADTSRNPKYLRHKYLAADTTASTFQSPKVQWLTPTNWAPCYITKSCARQVDALVHQGVHSRFVQAAVGIESPNHRLGTMVVASTHYNFALVIHMDQETYVDGVYQDLVAVFRYLNYIRIFVEGATVETCLFLQNKSTGELYQQSEYAFTELCLGNCQRRTESMENVLNAFTYRGSGYSITPDYRPEAVMGGFGATSKVFNLVVAVERDIIEIRGIILDTLARVLDKENKVFPQSFEIMLAHNKDAYKTKTFDPTDPCPDRVVCIMAEGYGVVFRSDCRHCTRQKRVTHQLVEYVNQLKLGKQCTAKGLNCTMEHLETKQDFTHQAVFSQVTHGTIRAPDYRDVDAIGYFGRASNFSTTYLLKQDYNEIFDPILEKIFLSLGASIVMVITALIILVVLSRSLIIKIEEDWSKNKEQIKLERRSFADQVREVFPMHIAEEVMNSKFMHVESRNISVSFIDLTQMSARLKDWPAVAVCRYMTYVHHVLEKYVYYFGLHRLRSIGETTIVLGGLDDDRGEEAATQQAKAHHCVAMLQFLTALYQTCTRRYAHFTHRADLIEETFGHGHFVFPDIANMTTNVGTINMPVFKTGVHFGHAVLCVIHLAGRPPHYDLAGQTAALTQRMVSSCKSGNIRVTENVKEQVDKDKAQRDNFEFTVGQTMLIRGRGMVTAHYLRAADVPVPLSVLQELGARFAKGSITFGEENKLLRDQSIISTSTSSSSRSAGSHDMGNSQKTASSSKGSK